MMMANSAGDDASTNVSDDAYFNAMFSGVSLQSFLAGANQIHHSLPPSLFGGGYIADALIFPNCTTPLFPPPTSNSDAAFLKLPKPEPMDLYEESAFAFHDPTPFPYLPDLCSFEQCSTSITKRARVDSMINPLSEGFQNFLAPYQYNPSPDLTASAAASPSVAQIPRSALARQRRQKLSDKTRCLQKLLPWDKKMDIATMLEEAFKYIKFLQAQLIALQSMPNESAISTTSNQNCIIGGFGGLERLNRNQLLQVLVNSPVAQTLLCSESFCVFSAEQLGLIRKFAEKRVLMQQMPACRHKT